MSDRAKLNKEVALVMASGLLTLRLGSRRAREALRQCLPDQLKDTTFAQVLKDDTTTKRWLAQLVKNLQEGQVTDPRGIPLPPQ